MSEEKLFVDIETFSEVDIKKHGAYKYTEHPSFEIILIAYRFGLHGEIKTFSPIHPDDGASLPPDLIDALRDCNVQKYAHNATFERLSFIADGHTDTGVAWECTMSAAAAAGLPLALAAASKALGLKELGKQATGKALINYFCKPCKPTKSNGLRVRNLPEHNPEKWAKFVEYCAHDVLAMCEVHKVAGRLSKEEQKLYELDQKINDRGVLIDVDMAEHAIEMNTANSKALLTDMKAVTGLANPNSIKQLKEWLHEQTGDEFDSLGKDLIPDMLIKYADTPVAEALVLRQKTSKTSIKKYESMINFACDMDNRARGTLKFHGASTGRWAGRGIQVHNLTKNKIEGAELDLARELISGGDIGSIRAVFDYEPSSILSQALRTAIIASPNNMLVVADYSAIEARVLAWLAGERWRLRVFETHGKIYEASASMMFGVPISRIGKGSELRVKGKVAELALGFQGAIAALIAMGAEKMGLTEKDMVGIVSRYRESNPHIVNMWRVLNDAAIDVIRSRSTRTVLNGRIKLSYVNDTLQIRLPSGRSLVYRSPAIGENRWGAPSIKFKGLDSKTHQWGWVETYGGKITENVVQAVARDVLAHGMLRLDAKGFDTVIHVHDEVGAEVPSYAAAEKLKEMCETLCEVPVWADGLPLAAEGYVSRYYKKD